MQDEKENKKKPPLRALFAHQYDALTIPDSGYQLARQLYEQAEVKPLLPEVLQNTVFDVADHALTHANNPNKKQGGMKQCLNMYIFPLPSRNALANR